MPLDHPSSLCAPISITDAPPPEIYAEVQADLNALRAALDASIPAKVTDRNLLIATWNIRAFASVTKKWTADADDSPKRDLRAIRYIAQIVSRFDVIAIQEVKGDLRALRYLLKLLNHQSPDWSFLMTDVTSGKAGNHERMAFVFDTRRVSLSGLAAELVVAPDDPHLPAGVAQNQFARTPYAVSFKAGWDTFVLTTVHIDYSSRPDGRQQELQAIANWLSRWAAQEASWNHNLIVLGDFNVKRQGDKLHQALTSSGLTVAPGTEALRRSLFDAPGVAPDKLKYYDQICWFAQRDGGRAELTMDYLRGGNFEFDGCCYQELGLSNANLQHRLSDHLPLWVEFGRGARLG